LPRRNRGDVCGVFQQSPDCRNVGWSTTVDTTALSNGAHTVTVTAHAVNGDQATGPPTSFTVSNTVTAGSTKIYIDEPHSQNETFFGYAIFSGWALDDSTAIKQVQLLVDGTPVRSGVLGVRRGDVCAVYPNRPGCPAVGWTFSFYTYTLADGIHTLTATALSAGGTQATSSAAFTVANPENGESTRI
jgi:hypothetical protein